ncbi:MAG: GNAT family N-acetyltransferase [Alphaproteobacteria bacterium]|nr:GNAT family N-acetyltransferase [Alphaproteobacteria bacterium]
MTIKVEKITEFRHSDLADLVQATEDAIREGIGFNWVVPPGKDVLETYWKGVLVVPQRVLLGGRLDGTLASSIQLVRPGASKETSSFAATLEAHFVAPWARGHGLAKALLLAAERQARAEGFSVLKLSVRDTQEPAIKLYEESGYILWGTLPTYEFVSTTMVPGRFYYKNLEPITTLV